MQGSHYDVLGLPTSACLEEIRAAYKKNILSHHPDKSSSDKLLPDGKQSPYLNKYSELSPP